jgi:hypothetical protein
MFGNLQIQQLSFNNIYKYFAAASGTPPSRHMRRKCYISISSIIIPGGGSSVTICPCISVYIINVSTFFPVDTQFIIVH